MKTRIAQCDLYAPLTPIWGLEGYDDAFILVRCAQQPIGVLYQGLRRWQATLSPAELKQSIATQLGILPAQQEAYQQAAISKSCQYPPISVVVGTRERPGDLRRCLEALQKLDYPDYEVVVVDNASRNDATAQVVAETSFRYVREERVGTSWARNRGVAEAKHDIVACIDDDVQVDAGWLRGIAEAFGDTQVGIMTGLVLPAQLETPSQHMFEAYSSMSKGVVAREFQRDSMRPQELIAVHLMGVGANMAFRRSVFDRIGGFDTKFGPGTSTLAGEDLDFFHRGLVAGFTLRYEPTAFVWHRHRRHPDELYRQVYTYGCGFGAYLLKLWHQQTVDRQQVARFLIRSWGKQWLAQRFIKSLLGRDRSPASLIFQEIRGALRAPRAYLATLK